MSMSKLRMAERIASALEVKGVSITAMAYALTSLRLAELQKIYDAYFDGDNYKVTE